MVLAPVGSLAGVWLGHVLTTRRSIRELRAAEIAEARNGLIAFSSSFYDSWDRFYAGMLDPSISVESVFSSRKDPYEQEKIFWKVVQTRFILLNEYLGSVTRAADILRFSTSNPQLSQALDTIHVVIAEDYGAMAASSRRAIPPKPRLGESDEAPDLRFNVPPSNKAEQETQNAPRTTPEEIDPKLTAEWAASLQEMVSTSRVRGKVLEAISIGRLELEKDKKLLHARGSRHRLAKIAHIVPGAT